MNDISHIPDAVEPIALFRRWFEDAAARESDLPDAMNLATTTPAGRPSSRMVLLKGFDENGFVFYTNSHSRKGVEIAANPFAAICFHWKSLGRQVRAEGKLAFVSDADSDAYWASRPRASQLAAWASDQSRRLADRAALQKRVEEATAKFAGASVPRPAHWKGYCLTPDVIEFWLNVPDRLHERLVFYREKDRWRNERLYP